MKLQDSLPPGLSKTIKFTQRSPTQGCKKCQRGPSIYIHLGACETGSFAGESSNPLFVRDKTALSSDIAAECLLVDSTRTVHSRPIPEWRVGCIEETALKTFTAHLSLVWRYLEPSAWVNYATTSEPMTHKSLSCSHRIK